ncbi:hypothetical protein L5515_006815 [Caenorhabditis briggsae]|uniref:Uncharacterized protein n=1 Tax=Caenorhabditis briggsae TaxID=6238 RepID=A0AAE9F0B0_CAEBR|nr:hypothetical protein L5515_006815 [Caenorhabditis briggsae]
MTPQTPRGRFCNNGSVSTFPSPTGSHSKNDKSVTTLKKSGNTLTTTLTARLMSLVYFDKLDIYATGRLLAQESKQRDIWPETESCLRKISNSVHDVVHVPRVFDYTPEEVMYCIEVKDLLKKYQEKPPVKIVQMPAISTNILEKIGAMWNVNRCSWKLNDVNFRVSDEWIQGYMTKEKNAKKIVKSFMTHILMNVCYFCPEVRRYENGGDKLEKVHHVKKERKRDHEELHDFANEERFTPIKKYIKREKLDENISRLPYWFSQFGCHKCVVASVSRSRSVRSFTGTGAPRTTETMIQQFHSKSFDFGKETGFNAVVLPCNYNLDLLHLLSEGVLKDWTKGLLFSSSTWVERNTTPATMRLFSKILAEVQNYTYSNSFIMSSKDFNRLTGSEIEAMAYVVLRIAVALHVFNDESIHVLLLGNFLICDSLYKKKYAEMKTIANLVGDFHDKSHPFSRNSNAKPRMERIHRRFIINLLSSSCAKPAVPVYIIFTYGSAEESNAFDDISKKEKY